MCVSQEDLCETWTGWGCTVPSDNCGGFMAAQEKLWLTAQLLLLVDLCSVEKAVSA